MKKINLKVLTRLLSRVWLMRRTLTFSRSRRRAQKKLEFYKQHYPPQDVELIFNMARSAHKILTDAKELNQNEMRNGMTLALDYCQRIVRILSQPRLINLTKEYYDE